MVSHKSTELVGQLCHTTHTKTINSEKLNNLIFFVILNQQMQLPNMPYSGVRNSSNNEHSNEGLTVGNVSFDDWDLLT